MTFGVRHLQEDRLFEYYLAVQNGEPIEPPAAEHLADCAECAARYDDLRRFMDGLRAEADDELDEIFSLEQQQAQRQHIARRIEHLTHPAHVISFPGHRSGSPAPSAGLRMSHHRWTSAAAAAGLLIGIGLGGLYYSKVPTGRRPAVASGSIAGTSGAAVPAAAPAVTNPVSDVDEQFLSELELAMERPHTRELVALDELTPHVREVRDQPR
jgi:hypothetical protein